MPRPVGGFSFHSGSGLWQQWTSILSSLNHSCFAPGKSDNQEIHSIKIFEHFHGESNNGANSSDKESLTHFHFVQVFATSAIRGIRFLQVLSCVLLSSFSDPLLVLFISQFKIILIPIHSLSRSYGCSMWIGKVVLGDCLARSFSSTDRFHF